MIGVIRDTVYWANFNALWLIEMADALGTQIRINFINLFAFINGVIGTNWLANIAVNAFISNH